MTTAIDFAAQRRSRFMNGSIGRPFVRALIERIATLYDAPPPIVESFPIVNPTPLLSPLRQFAATAPPPNDSAGSESVANRRATPNSPEFRKEVTLTSRDKLAR